MVRSLEKKWRALAPNVELQIRKEILTEYERGQKEATEKLNASEPDSKEYRVASRTRAYFLEQAGFVGKRIKVLQAIIDEMVPPAETEADKARIRKLSTLRQNSRMMLKRFLIVTPGFNADFTQRAGKENLEGVDVDAVLRTHGIRLVSLDNPERWGVGGEFVEPQKLLGLHPSDITRALKVISQAVSTKDLPVYENERSERATVVWLPMKSNGWQHPDKSRTVYPPRITRLAMNRSEKNTMTGWAVLRGWGRDLDIDLDPINGCNVEFEYNIEKGRFEALLSPDDVEEILL